MKSDGIRLPRSTSRTVTGPKLEGTGQRACVIYDYEHDDGRIEWTRVIFDDVLVLEYRRDSLCTEHDIVGPCHVRCLSGSRWLEELVGHLCESEMWVRSQEKKGGVRRFSHFTIFFDDVACINVIASSCTIEEEAA